MATTPPQPTPAPEVAAQAALDIPKKDIDLVIALGEALAAAGVGFEASTAAGAHLDIAVVNGVTAGLSKLLPDHIFGNNVSAVIEAVIAGGVSFVAAEAAGGTLAQGIIAGVISFLTKIKPTQVLS